MDWVLLLLVIAFGIPVAVVVVGLLGFVWYDMFQMAKEAYLLFAHRAQLTREVNRDEKSNNYLRGKP